MKKLFIKKFKTNKQYYVYDVRSNRINKVSNVVWDMIDHYQESLNWFTQNFKNKYSCEDLSNAYESIQKATYLEVFSDFRPKVVQSNKIRRLYIEDAFKKYGLKQIILDLTNQCNLRCKYCVFSNNYQYTRAHQNKKMEKETAKKAIDYFLKYSSENNPAITFYGGEPLLNFGTLKYIVEYVKKITDRSKYKFSFTTNGTLLNDEIIEYLVDNDISISISIDGPEDIHNKNRIFKNGRGSFNRIMNNLRKIKKKAPDYFQSNVSFILVVTPPYDFKKIESFFFRSDFFKNKEKQIQISPISLSGTSLIGDEKFYNKELYSQVVKKTLLSYKNKLISGNYEDLTYEKLIFEQDIIGKIHFRLQTPLNKSYHASLGQCIPGFKRLFVNPNGNYYMCEKVGENFKIGDIQKGLNFEKIMMFINRWDEFFKDCKDCWAIRLCKKCFDNVNKGDHFDKKRKDILCKKKLNYIESLLKVYCEILEDNSESLKIFNIEDFINIGGKNEKNQRY